MTPEISPWSIKPGTIIVPGCRVVNCLQVFDETGRVLASYDIEQDVVDIPDTVDSDGLILAIGYLMRAMNKLASRSE